MRAHFASSIAMLCLLAACSGGAQQSEVQPAAQQPAAQSAAPAPQEQAPAAQPAPVEQAPATQPPPPPPPRPAATTSPAGRAPQRQPAATTTPARKAARVPAGTVLTLALDAEVSSKTAQVGDAVSATVLEAVVVDGRDLIAAGAVVHGTVTEAVAAKRGAGNAKLALSFDRLRLEDGFETSIVGSFREVSESKKKRNAAVIGGSAAGGALLGRILGKDTKGAVVGSVIGGGIGTAVVLGKEGEQVTLPADTPFEIHLDEAVEVPE